MPSTPVWVDYTYGCCCFIATRCPRLAGWVDRMLKEPGVRATYTEPALLVKYYHVRGIGKPEYGGKLQPPEYDLYLWIMVLYLPEYDLYLWIKELHLPEYDLYLWIMELHLPEYDLYLWIMELHQRQYDLYLWIMELHPEYDLYLWIMELHLPEYDLYLWIMELHLPEYDLYLCRFMHWNNITLSLNLNFTLMYWQQEIWTVGTVLSNRIES